MPGKGCDLPPDIKPTDVSTPSIVEHPNSELRLDTNGQNNANICHCWERDNGRKKPTKTSTLPSIEFHLPDRNMHYVLIYS